jgi:hypothetical protein
MKQIKDTKLGAFLKDKAPQVLNIVGELMPESGTLGVVKNLIKVTVPDRDKRETIASELNEKTLEIEKEFLEDTQNAREMYQNTGHKMADSIAEKVIKINLPVIFCLIVANVAAVWLLQGKGEIIAIVSNFIGIAIGHLFNERQSVINFFFGSSQGSKNKDKNTK